jgi:hypothetical protein
MDNSLGARDLGPPRAGKQKLIYLDLGLNRHIFLYIEIEKGSW